jgi:hypothetical protein
MPNDALPVRRSSTAESGQRTAAGHRSCNRRATWPPSLTYIGSLGHITHNGLRCR